MSKEDIKLNVGQEEIRYIDNNMETIVDTITKQIISDKDLAIAQHIIQKLQQECEANKKRIEELEKENKKKSVGIICLQEELENSIPKAKIKEKIEDLLRFVEAVGLLVDEEEITATEKQIEILEELLKDKGN